MLMRAAALTGFWAVGVTLLSWPHLSGTWRRRLAVLASALGIVALVQAVTAEGLRESPTVAVFLVGAAYVVDRTSASASLPYYVVTGVCLTLGFVGLAAGEGVARLLRQHWLVSAILLSLFVTAVRFMLEKVAAPPIWAWTVGVTWLAPVVGAYFALNLKAESRGLGALLQALVIYAFSVRGAVAALMLVATALRLGSHYDVSSLTLVQDPFRSRAYSFEPGSREQILYLSLIPQLVAWPIYTVVSGLVGAGIARLIVGRPGLPAVTPPPGRVAPASD
jgi:hypothetical protein